ncbi:hypothetical protein KVA01_21620 [Kocuria varians]|uniref:Uncharacterized protein n=1 Tax=Kocuria varians TaxID=1272 RepID=A0A4Y4D9P2_KOCVA|nr:hypothetical protein KVA01_21620 [Kocuria varians]
MTFSRSARTNASSCGSTVNSGAAGRAGEGTAALGVAAAGAGPGLGTPPLLTWAAARDDAAAARDGALRPVGAAPPGACGVAVSPVVAGDAADPSLVAEAPLSAEHSELTRAGRQDV